MLLPASLFAAPFMPPTDSLAFHLQANRGVVVGSAGVTGWLDQTSAGIDFAVDTSVAGRAPAFSANQFNRLPALSFSSDKLFNNAFEFGVDQTVFVVLAGNNVESDQQRYMGHSGDGQLRYKNGYLHGWFGNGTLSPEDTEIAVTAGQFALATYQFNSGNVLVAANGNPFVTLRSGTPSFSTSSSLSIGAVGDVAPNFTGRIAEVLVYDKALSATERAAVESYLGDKYLKAIRPEVIPYATTRTDPHYPTAVLYHMDGNGLDSSGNGLHLTRHGGASHDVWVDGPTGLDLGTGPINSVSRVLHKGNLSTAEVGLFDTKTFTIEAWVRNPTLGVSVDQMPVFYYRNGTNSRLDLVVTTADRLELRMLHADTSAFTTYATTSPVIFEEDAWYHLAVTYDNNGDATTHDSTLRFYLTSLDDFSGQATLVQTMTGVVDIKTLTAGGNLIIGGADYMASRLFGGDIDQFRYVNRALAPHEFNLAMPVPEPGAAMLALLALVGFGVSRRRQRS
ncbi:MAG: LamG-like jellyroll fold domain-containing protein [Patescibacteria group bacterium]|nr:LamG-like jellyroll fold domain-containing protein [Patescibacteria group bacterium]